MKDYKKLYEESQLKVKELEDKISYVARKDEVLNYYVKSMQKEIRKEAILLNNKSNNKENQRYVY